jgi:acyl-coenzyme A synthetase/AMP-(fatty) acid ligase
MIFMDVVLGSMFFLLCAVLLVWRRHWAGRGQKPPAELNRLSDVVKSAEIANEGFFRSLELVQKNLEALIARAESTAKGYDCRGGRAGNLYIQFWLYYEDSTWLGGVAPGGVEHHEDDWEGGQVRVTPEGVLAFFGAVKPTIFLSVPTFYRSMLAIPGFAAQLRDSSFRFMVSTGETLGAAVWKRWHEETGITICELYGVSEVQSLVSNSPLLPVKPGSIGKPAPGVKVALLNDRLMEVGPGESGVFAIHRSDPGLFLEYQKQPDKWKAQHRGEWYYTGDVMSTDEDGYFWYVGRGDDLFKSRGYLISPHEIENVLQRHPAVAEVAVVPEPDERTGNTIAAFALLRPGHDASEVLETAIIEFAREHLAPYKVPKSLRFIAEMPKSPVGKILRRALRDGPKS